MMVLYERYGTHIHNSNVRITTQIESNNKSKSQCCIINIHIYGKYARIPVKYLL